MSYLAISQPFRDGDSYGLSHNALVTTPNTSDNGVVYYKAKLGIEGMPVSVRFVSNKNGNLMKKEKDGFRRAREVDCERNFERVLKALYMFEAEAGCYFVYEWYDDTLLEYVMKNRGNSDLETKWPRIMRATFCAFNEIHYIFNESHGDQQWPINIVVVNEPHFKVQLWGLGYASEDKLTECRSLALFFESYTRALGYTCHLEQWFASMMGTLRLGKVRNLHNAPRFLGAEQKFAYLREAGKKVLNGPSYFFTQEFLGDDGASTWVANVSNVPGAFKNTLYFGKLDSETEEEFRLKHVSSHTTAVGFLRFCRNYAEHGQSTESVNDQWVRLYNFWPRFFDILHEKLVKHDIYVFEQ